jgi:protoporphyrinogen oxidase
MSFVVVGAGPCGLAAAWHLARRGARPVVLESEASVGGLCATHERNGWRFDLGGHRFVSADAELSRWIEGLLGDDLLEQERRSIVLHQGRSFRYPLEPLDLVRRLGPQENASALLSYARARLVRAVRRGKDESFEDWVTARFGRWLYERFFGPYTEKLWGLHPSRISADWAVERISLLGLGDVALRLAGLRRSATRTYARRYRYPRLGMGQLYAAIAEDIRSHGGSIRTRARVRGIETEGRRARAVHIETPEGPERVPCGELLSTMPLPDLAHHLAIDASSEVARAVSALRFRALTFVNLCLSRPRFSDNTWMYVATSALRTSRIQEPKQRSAAMAPPGKTSLMLEIPCEVDDNVWSAGYDELLLEGRREMGALGFRVDDVVDGFCVRVRHGYPVYHLRYDVDRRSLLGQVARFENVRTAGRQGLFRYVFMDAAMRMGIEAADQMLTGRRDGGAVDAIGRSSHLLETTAITA